MLRTTRGSVRVQVHLTHSPKVREIILSLGYGTTISRARESVFVWRMWTEILISSPTLSIGTYIILQPAESAQVSVDGSQSWRSRLSCGKFVPRNGHARTLIVLFPTTKAANAKTRICRSEVILYFLSSQPPSLAAGHRRATTKLWVTKGALYRRDRAQKTHRFWLDNSLMRETGWENHNFYKGASSQVATYLALQ